MHRHEHSRVVIALATGSLKITNDKGKSPILHLEKGHAYFLEKDRQDELHTDDNISNHPISVVVVELK